MHLPAPGESVTACGNCHRPVRAVQLDTPGALTVTVVMCARCDLNQRPPKPR